MIPEAEVFVLADQAAVQVYGQIREDHWDSSLPPLFEMPGADQPPVSSDASWRARFLALTGRQP